MTASMLAFATPNAGTTQRSVAASTAAQADQGPFQGTSGTCFPALLGHASVHFWDMRPRTSGTCFPAPSAACFSALPGAYTLIEKAHGA